MKKLEKWQIDENVKALREQGWDDSEINDYLSTVTPTDSKKEVSSMMGKGFKEMASEIKGDKVSKLQQAINRNALPMGGDIAGTIAGEELGGMAGGAIGFSLGGPGGAAVGIPAGKVVGGAIGAGLGSYAGQKMTDENNPELTQEEVDARAKESGILSSAITGGLGVAGIAAKKAGNVLEGYGKLYDVSKEMENISGKIESAVKENELVKTLKKRTDNMVDAIENKSIILKDTYDALRNQWASSFENAKKGKKFGGMVSQLAPADSMDELLDALPRLKDDVAKKVSTATKIARKEFSNSYDDFFNEMTDSGASVKIGDELNALRDLAPEPMNTGTQSSILNLQNNIRGGTSKSYGDVSLKPDTEYAISEWAKNPEVVNRLIVNDLKSQGLSDDAINMFLSGSADEIPLKDAHRVKQAVESIKSKVFRSGSAEDKDKIGKALGSISNSLVGKIDEASGGTGIYSKLSDNWRELLTAESIAKQSIGQFGVGHLSDLRIDAGGVVNSILRESKDPLMTLNEITDKKISAVYNQIGLLRNSGNENLIKEADAIENSILDLQANVRSRKAIEEKIDSLAKFADEATKEDLSKLKKNLERYQDFVPDSIHGDDWRRLHVGSVIGRSIGNNPIGNAVKNHAAIAFMEKAVNPVLRSSGKIYTDSTIKKRIISMIDKKIVGDVSARELKLLNLAKAYLTRDLTDLSDQSESTFNEDQVLDSYVRTRQ